MKYFYTFLLTVLSTLSVCAGSAVDEAIDSAWQTCREAIVNNEFKGEPLFENDYSVPDNEKSIREKFFKVPNEALKEFIVGRNGQIGYAVYRENILCAGKLMNTFCGSGGCTRDFIINDQRYELFGGEPILVHMESLPVILVGRSALCATSPNSVNCVQAYVWDEQLEQFNTFGGHQKNDKLIEVITTEK